MEIPVTETKQLKVKFVEVHVKVRDQGCYTLIDEAGTNIAEINEDYVPSFFPGEHYGDYLILKIDIETGRIVNWKQPTPLKVSEAFKLIKEEE